jgi:hypothetical protein
MISGNLIVLKPSGTVQGDIYLYSSKEINLFCVRHSLFITQNLILPFVLYVCETWSFTLRKECRLSVFENRVLRRTFWPKRDEVKGEWRKLHNEELSDLYSSPRFFR